MDDIVKGLLSGSGDDTSSAEMLLRTAEWASHAFSAFDHPNVMAIAKAAAEAGHAAAGRLAELAVRETGFGVIADKKTKNELSSLGLYDYYRDVDYCSARVDPAAGIVELPRPAGVILGLVPSTNPVCTTFCKLMLAILTRNAIVISPHPRAKQSTIDAVKAMADAAERAGAPSGLIQVVSNPTLPIIEYLMRSPRVGVTLATGGLQVVRAAYSSGNPAIGVGPGNAPALVDDSANPALAAARITASKSFDNSTLCTNESVVVADASIAAELLKEFIRNDVYVANAEETDKLRQYLFGSNGFNVEALGQSAVHIAQQAGFRVPGTTKVILTPVEKVGIEEPLTREKLCPVLGFIQVHGIDEGIRVSASITRHSGAGHSAAIHSQRADNIARFATSLNVLRIIVNAPCSQGAAGFATNLTPSFTVGTGFVGRSSVGDNIGPQHLVNWTRIAYGQDEVKNFPAREFESMSMEHRPRAAGREAPLSLGSLPPANPKPLATVEIDGLGQVREEIRRMVLEEIRHALRR